MIGSESVVTAVAVSDVVSSHTVGPNTRAVRLANASGVGFGVVYVGVTNGVTDADGFPVRLGESVVIDVVGGMALYFICGAALTADLRIVEEM